MQIPLHVQLSPCFECFMETKDALNPICLKDPLISSLSEYFHYATRVIMLFSFFQGTIGCFINLVIILLVCSLRILDNIEDVTSFQVLYVISTS